ncbi:DUF808 domain-containing protein [Wenxinia saemankumensis]|uniref:Inner membrane protein YedI n=1 Tax=Wenxinia saemankumensis TaxID=1447782 RepID=A0A1M6ET81_9RHOB|nr:DUF808 domain-containing protein [Wenxinia saemankumensis]SHI88672.1 hypothetical protein SAMN05444417_2162 [Wenxinia saemankumensis]
MSGLIALLDDVSAIAKVAAASIDDVAAGAMKAGTKTAGVLIDDAAVTPKYVTGFSPKRELPIIWKIARGSIFNKLVILLPIALLLANFAPWAITPLLMLGGSYLCFEGAEKIVHVLAPHASEKVDADLRVEDPTKLEERKVRGAIKTDFILSAEIMTIALSTVEADSVWLEAATLAVVAVAITAAVYGSVALIVKADDVGLALAQRARLGASRALGRGLVRWMPAFLRLLSIVGTAAMLWVGGNIVVHGLHDLGWHLPYDWIHDRAEWVADRARAWHGFVAWAVTAFFDGILGLAWGLVLIPLVTGVFAPAVAAVTGKRQGAH